MKLSFDGNILFSTHVYIFKNMINPNPQLKISVRVGRYDNNE